TTRNRRGGVARARNVSGFGRSFRRTVWPDLGGDNFGCARGVCRRTLLVGRDSVAIRGGQATTHPPSGILADCLGTEWLAPPTQIHLWTGSHRSPHCRRQHMDRSQLG